MNYFILLSESSSKNALQRAIEAHVKQFDHHLCDKPTFFEEKIEKQIQKLNNLHHRCTPVKVSSNRRYRLIEKDGDFSIYLDVPGWYTHIHFHEIKGEAEL